MLGGHRGWVNRDMIVENALQIRVLYLSVSEAIRLIHCAISAADDPTHAIFLL